MNAALGVTSDAEGWPGWDDRDTTLIRITPEGGCASANTAGYKRRLLDGVAPGDVLLATAVIWPDDPTGHVRRFGPLLVDDVDAVRAALGM